MKVALVHDYLREYGGAERVLEALHEMFPNAPLYTAYYNPTSLGIHADRFKNWDIRTSWIQNLPLANKLISPLRIFAPLAFDSFDLKEYDLVISSSAIYFAKAVITKPECLHLAYIHTPPRYLYGYATSFNYKKNPVTRVLGEIANHFLRLYDFETSQRPDVLVANSENTKMRIKKFYRRDAEVVYPPVDIKRLHTPASLVRVKSEEGKDGGYFLSLGRLVRGKGVETIVEACAKAGVSLKVAGFGPEMAHLSALSSRLGATNIEFLGAVTDEAKFELLANAKALIVASEDEDFGITNIESLSCGTPVLAFKAGGYLETVVEGKTGEFFDGETAKEQIENLSEILKKFDPKKYSEAECRKQSDKFSKEKFQQKLLEVIKKNFKP